MTDFDTAFANVVGAEGAFGNDAGDPGNWTGGAKGKGVLKGTKFGISAMSYPALDIRSLTLADAKAIYLRDFWTPAGGTVLPWPLNYLIFDTVVNQGGGPAYWKGEMQTALGVRPDGNIAVATIAAAKAAMASPDRKREVVGLFVAARVARYVAKSDAKYQRGLFKRAVVTAMRCAA